MAKTLCYHCMRMGVESGACVYCGRRPSRFNPREGDLALPPGTELDNGNVIVGECLGSGGFGITYIALDRKENRRIALKEFVPRYMLSGRRGKELIVRSDLREIFDKNKHSFMKEADLLSKLEHENIVRVYFSLDENGTAYYGMELLEGEDLAQYVRRNGELDPKDAYRLLEPIMDALIYLHSTGSEGTFHRDISPDNIFLRKGGSPCLIDFGAAATSIQGFSESHPNVRKNGYSPLEQNWSGSEQGAHTDIYALAATLYYVLSGNVPPSSNDRMVEVSSHGGSGLTPLTRLNSRVSKWQEQVIEKGLALLPDGRYRQMREFKEALREAIFGQERTRTGPATQTGQTWPTKPPTRTESGVQPGTGAQTGSVPGETPPPHVGISEPPRLRRSPSRLAALLMDYAVFLGLPLILGFALGAPALCLAAGAAAMTLVDLLCCALRGGTLFQGILGCHMPKARPLDSAVYNLLRLIPPLALVDEIVALVRNDNSWMERVSGFAKPAPETERASQPAAPEEPRRLQFLRCVEGVYKGRKFVLDQEHCLGRDKRFTTITFPRECIPVSYRHCALRPSTAGWRVADLNSMNGTFINDVRLPAGGISEPLKRDDRLRVGNEVFVYEDD